jgi:hypothetical protein
MSIRWRYIPSNRCQSGSPCATGWCRPPCPASVQAPTLTIDLARSAPCAVRQVTRSGGGRPCRRPPIRSSGSCQSYPARSVASRRSCPTGRHARRRIGHRAMPSGRYCGGNGCSGRNRSRFLCRWPRAPSFCLMSVSSESDSEVARGRCGSRAWRRSAAATLTGPARLSMPMTRLRKAAMTLGPAAGPQGPRAARPQVADRDRGRDPSTSGRRSVPAVPAIIAVDTVLTPRRPFATDHGRLLSSRR